MQLHTNLAWFLMSELKQPPKNDKTALQLVAHAIPGCLYDGETAPAELLRS